MARKGKLQSSTEGVAVDRSNDRLGAGVYCRENFRQQRLARRVVEF